MTYLIERLAELRRHLDHLRALQPRVRGREALNDLEPIERFLQIVRHRLSEEEGAPGIDDEPKYLCNSLACLSILSTR